MNFLFHVLFFNVTVYLSTQQDSTTQEYSTIQKKLIQENSTIEQNVIIKKKTYQIPEVVRGDWFSWENGRNTRTEINADHMTDRGKIIYMNETQRLNYTFIFQKDTCYHCVKLIVRTINILEKVECKYEFIKFVISFDH